MGWNINRAIEMVYSILGNKVVAFSYTPDSNSAIDILFRGDITAEEEDKVVSLFPVWIRIEFKVAQWELMQEDEADIKEYEKKGNNWVPKGEYGRP